MLRSAFVRNRFEGNCLALEPVFAVVQVLSLIGKDMGCPVIGSISMETLSLLCIHPSRSAGGCVKPARGLFTVHL